MVQYYRHGDQSPDKPPEQIKIGSMRVWELDDDAVAESYEGVETKGRVHDFLIEDTKGGWLIVPRWFVELCGRS